MILRFSHHILLVAHLVMIYIDDSLFLVSKQVAPYAFTLIMFLWIILGVPFKFSKVEIGTKISWLGYVIDLCTHQVGFDPTKLKALLDLIEFYLGQRFITLQELQRLA